MTQDVDTQTFYDVGKGLTDKAGAVIDGRASGISREEAQRGLDRFLVANPGRMTNIRIVWRRLGDILTINRGRR